MERHPLIIAAFSFLLCWWILLPGVPGTLPVGDAPELAAAAWFLGVAHPPGYPLWVTAAHSMVFVSIGSIALRMNAFSALCSALVCDITGRMAGAGGWTRVLTAVSAATLLRLVPAIAGESTNAEVYALHHLLLWTLLIALERLWENPGWRRWLLLCLTVGLGGANHQTFAFAAAVAMLLGGGRLISRMCVRAVPILAAGTLAAALGLSVYTHIPLRGGAAIAWGQPRTLSAAWRHITRTEYGPLPQSRRSPVRIGEQAVALISRAGSGGRTSLIVLIVPAVIAALLIAPAMAARQVLVLGAIPLGLVAMIDFSVSPKELAALGKFVLPLTLLSIAWSAIALGRGLQWISARAGGCWLGWSAAASLTLGASLLPPARDCGLSAAYASDALNALPANARLVAIGDHDLFPLAFARFVERRRPDVELIDGSGQFLPGSLFRPPYTFVSQSMWMEASQAAMRSLRDRPLFTTFQADAAQRPAGVLYAWPEDAARLRTGVDWQRYWPPSEELLASDSIVRSMALGMGLLAAEQGVPVPPAIWFGAVGADQPDWWISRAALEIHQGQWDLARDHLEMALRCFPREETALRLLVPVLLQLDADARRREVQALLDGIERRTYRGLEPRNN